MREALEELHKIMALRAEVMKQINALQGESDQFVEVLKEKMAVGTCVFYKGFVYARSEEDVHCFVADALNLPEGEECPACSQPTLLGRHCYWCFLEVAEETDERS